MENITGMDIRNLAFLLDIMQTIKVTAATMSYALHELKVTAHQLKFQKIEKYLNASKCP